MHVREPKLNHWESLGVFFLCSNNKIKWNNTFIAAITTFSSTQINNGRSQNTVSFLAKPVKSILPLNLDEIQTGYTGRNPSPQRRMQTFGSHLLIIWLVTHSLIVNFTEPARVHLHHLMTLADLSLLSLTMIECSNREVSNNWVNKVMSAPTNSCLNHLSAA